MSPPNIPWLVFLACCDGDRFSDETLYRLQTVLDLSDLYDLVEARQAHSSWMAAAQRNAELRHGQGGR